MVDVDRARVWAVRLAAPIAFFAAATVLIVLVQQGLSSGDSNAVDTTTPAVTTPTTATTAPTTTEGAKRRFYRVRAGDTLESIAAKFDTTVADLLDLNPGIDPLALSPRQRIRVR
jgi:LysM repeat protein